MLVAPRKKSGILLLTNALRAQQVIVVQPFHTARINRLFLCVNAKFSIYLSFCLRRIYAGAVVLDALIGGYQEWRAEKSNRALQKIRAIVVRGGKERSIK